MRWRTAFIAIVVLAIVGIVAAVSANHRRHRYEASLEAVIKHGGQLKPDKRPFLLSMLIDLSHSELSDQTLAELDGLTYGPEFELNLSFTRVTDRGLKHLVGIRVWKVNLTATKVTSDGVEMLQRARPNLEIEWHDAKTSVDISGRL